MVLPWKKNFDIDGALEKSMQAFWTRGYEATSMQDLVDRTGVNRGSLYATYGDKHAIFVAALRMYDDKMRRQVLDELAMRHTPREAIRGLLLAFAKTGAKRSENRGCFLTNTALELAPHDLEVGRIVSKAQKEIEAFFARMIRKGMAQGEIAAKGNVGDIARGCLATLLGLVVLTRSRPDKELLHGIIEDAMRRLE